MLLRLFFVAVLLLAPLAAQADGPGIALTDDARLHFFAESELRFDSLAAQGGVGTTSTNTQFDPGDFIFHLRPGLKIEQTGGTTFSVTGSANLDWVDYTGWLAPDHQLSYLGAAVNAALAVGKTGPVGFVVSESFSRSDQTTNPSLGLGTITDLNDLGAKLVFRPGGGAIEAGFGYDFNVESYELHAPGDLSCGNIDCDGSQYGKFDSTTHKFGFDARWKFFPKTAVVLDANLELREYGDTTVNFPAMPLVVEAGLAGLITEKIRVVVKGGYANTFLQQTSIGSGNDITTIGNFSSGVGQIEVGWDPSETISVTAGVMRAVQPVSGTDGWYDDWRGYAGGKLLLAGRVALTVNGNVDVLDYADGRQDTQAQATGAVDVEIFRMFHTALGAVLSSRDSSYGGLFTYNRKEVFLRLNFTY